MKTSNLAIYANGNVQSSKLALVLPGLLDTKDYPHMKAHVDFLASKGFDYRRTPQLIKEVNHILEEFIDEQNTTI